jgi:hypothetical protein
MKFKLVLFFVSLISVLLVSSFFYNKPSEIIKNSTHSTELLVYMSPTCNCCKNWAKQLSDYGFLVKSKLENNMQSIKSKAGITSNLVSCHTAFIEDYVIEGHVPPKDILKLLSEKPNIKGLSVPGMPAGSNVPGMEVRPEKANFNVLAINNNGSTTVWNHYE